MRSGDAVSVVAAVGAVVALVWAVGAVGWAGALWERERLLNAEGRRDWRWAGAWVLSSLAWPFVGLLWHRSRPVPSPQPPLRADDFYQGYLAPSRELLPEDEASMYRGVMAVDFCTSLALQGHLQPGQKVFVKSLGLILVRGQMYWAGESCGCRYNFSGFPVVVCRVHRSDLDPQGEPDDDAGSVGL